MHEHATTACLHVISLLFGKACGKQAQLQPIEPVKHLGQAEQAAAAMSVAAVLITSVVSPRRHAVPCLSESQHLQQMLNAVTQMASICQCSPAITFIYKEAPSTQCHELQAVSHTHAWVGVMSSKLVLCHIPMHEFISSTCFRTL